MTVFIEYINSMYTFTIHVSFSQYMIGNVYSLAENLNFILAVLEEIEIIGMIKIHRYGKDVQIP